MVDAARKKNELIFYWDLWQWYFQPIYNMLPSIEHRVAFTNFSRTFDISSYVYIYEINKNIWLLLFGYVVSVSARIGAGKAILN